jgi:hypothetical protein
MSSRGIGSRAGTPDCRRLGVVGVICVAVRFLADPYSDQPLGFLLISLMFPVLGMAVGRLGAIFAALSGS